MPRRPVPLATLRRRRLLSQRALAEKAGVTQATLVALERGKSTPRLITMEKIAEALGVEASEIDEFHRTIEGRLEAAA